MSDPNYFLKGPAPLAELNRHSLVPRLCCLSIAPLNPGQPRTGHLWHSPKKRRRFLSTRQRL